MFSTILTPLRILRDYTVQLPGLGPGGGNGDLVLPGRATLTLVHSNHPITNFVVDNVYSFHKIASIN